MTALGRTTAPTPTSRGGRRTAFFFCLLAYFTHTPYESNTLSIERTFFFLFRPCLLAGAGAAAPAANMPLSDQIPIVGVFSLLFYIVPSQAMFEDFISHAETQQRMTIILHIRANAAMEKKVAAIRR